MKQDIILDKDSILQRLCWHYQEESEYESVFLLRNPKLSSLPLDNKAQICRGTLPNQSTFNSKHFFPHLPKLNRPQNPGTLIQLSTLKTFHQITFQVDDKELIQYPYCAIGMIIVGKRMLGTGFVVGPRHVVTCASILSSLEGQFCQQKISYTPAPELLAGLEKYKACSIYSPISHAKCSLLQFKTNPSLNLAILQLDTSDNLEDIYGSFQLDFTWPSTVNEPTLINHCLLIGFASSHQRGYVVLQQFQGNMWVDGPAIKHNMQKKRNSVTSGSPILQVQDGTYYVRGIHTIKESSKGSSHFVGLSFDQSIFGNSFPSLGNAFSLPFEEHLKMHGFVSLMEANLSFLSLGHQACRYLRDILSVNLQYLKLNSNYIGDEGCKYLAEANWINLRTMRIRNNDIGARGCQFLKKAQWPLLITLGIGDNTIGNQGCKHLTQASWPLLRNLFLNHNGIESIGCRYLSEAYWFNLRYFSFESNWVGDEGCRYLKEAPWPKLDFALLYDLMQTERGRKHLSCKDWKIEWERQYM